VHIRNRNGRTPLFLAANAGLSEHVLLLRKSGAHLHSEERQAAELLARRRPAVWGLAGIGPREVSNREMEEEDEAVLGRREVPGRMLVGSAP
jgi:lysophospholipase